MIVSLACVRTSTINRSTTIRLCANAVRVGDDSSGIDFYTSNCGLKSYRKQWLQSNLCNHNIASKTYFANPSGFIRSLVIVVCFAWCVVISGIAVNTAFLSSLYRVNAPHQALIGVVRLLMIFSEHDLFIPIKCNFKMKAWIHDNIRSTEEKHHHDCTMIHGESSSSDLDNILAVISMLLLISGDVELNPGPKDHKTKSSQPRFPDASDHELDPPSIPKGDNSHVPSIANASDPQKCLTSSPTSTHAMDESYQGIEDQRKFMLTGSPDSDSKNLLTSKEGDIKLFKRDTEPEDTPDDLLGTDYNRPIEEGCEYPVVTPDLAIFLKKITIYDDGLQEAPDFSEVEDFQSKPKFAMTLNKELDSVSARFSDSFAKHNLDDCTTTFFSHANKLFRAGCRCHYCVICGNCKRDDTRNSHVFPEGLLIAFRRIHVYNAKQLVKSVSGKSKHEAMPKEVTEFMYDFVLDKRFGTSAWTYDLLCASCELKCSPAEQRLRNAYVRMMKASSFILPLLISNEECWFHFILTMIMFRGLLVSENLSDHFSDPNFRNGFTELWNFCKQYLRSAATVCNNCIIPDLRLFLLPNQAINIEMIHFLYSLEYSLRCPMFARHIRSSENGTFFYWKFDCLHVVLALDPISLRYFNYFHHSLDLQDGHKEYLVLHWINMQCSDVTRSEPSGAVKIKYRPNLKRYVFPPMLLKENIDLNTEFFKRLYDQATVTDCKFNISPSSKVMTSRFCGLGHSYPSTEKMLFSPTETKCMELVKYPVNDDCEIEFIDASINNTKLDEYIEAASGLSPLRFPERNAELKRENELLKAQMAAMGKDDTSSVDELIQSNRKLDKVKKELEDSKKKYDIKKKKAGDTIVQLNKTIVQLEERAATAERSAATAERKAATAEQRAEQALLEKNKLKFENQELKRHIQFVGMMQRELRLSQNQLTRVRSSGHRSREHFSVRNARKMILMRMEFMELQCGQDFSAHKEFCKKVLIHVEIETSCSKESVHNNIMKYSSLDYLDLAINNFSEHKSSQITEAYCRSTSYHY